MRFEPRRPGRPCIRCSTPAMRFIGGRPRRRPRRFPPHSPTRLCGRVTAGCRIALWVRLGAVFTLGIGLGRRILAFCIRLCRILALGIRLGPIFALGIRLCARVITLHVGLGRRILTLCIRLRCRVIAFHIGLGRRIIALGIGLARHVLARRNWLCFLIIARGPGLIKPGRRCIFHQTRRLWHISWLVRPWRARCFSRIPARGGTWFCRPCRRTLRPICPLRPLWALREIPLRAVH